MERKKEESVTQQLVLNCLDYWNSELEERNIDKQYRIDISIYDNNKTEIIGARKDLEVTVRLTYFLQIKKSNKTVKLWETTETAQTLKGKMPSSNRMQKTIDQCFLKFVKECIGMFGIIAEQKIINTGRKSDNG
tara:strand:- start:24602 stop:25003 length:402 start_codon:yes stop_codon:yes gene_type:complete